MKHMRKLIKLLLAVGLIVQLSAVAIGQTHEVKLTAPGSFNAAGFGAAVAIDGETLVVGAINLPDVGFPPVGDVFVYRYDGTSWNFVQALAPPGGDNAGFGSAVAISGDTIAVGAYGAGLFGGEAHVFTRNGSTWDHTAEIVPDDVTNGDNFGLAVALDGNLLAVGARGTDNTGAVYVYARSGASWTLDEKLTANDSQPTDKLGITVSIDGTTVAAGEAERGAAYVFERDGDGVWSQEKLTDNPPEGSVVAISGERVLVGRASGGLSVAVYENTSGWAATAALTVDGVDVADHFGAAVALNGRHALIGSPGEGTGTAALFQPALSQANSWGLLAQFTPGDGTAGDYFGAAVALSADWVLIGAPGHNGGAGAAYLYTVPTITLEVVSVHPATGTLAAPTTDLTLAFNQAVQAGDGSIRIEQAGQLIEEIIMPSPRVIIDGSTVTIDPATLLAYGRTYTVTVDESAFTIQAD
jgi:hypothetical protein